MITQPRAGYGPSRARADIDCARGLADLEQLVELAPEWADATRADGRTTSVEPRRAMLAGMLAHLRGAGR
jgi:hypothetical protein